MDKGTELSENYVEIPPTILQLLKHYIEIIEGEKKPLWVDVSRHIESNEITVRGLMKAILCISFYNETDECNSTYTERSLRENIVTFSKFIPLFAEMSKDLSNQIELLEGIQSFFCSEEAKGLC